MVRQRRRRAPEMAGPGRIRADRQPDMDQREAHPEVRRQDVSPEYPVYGCAKPQRRVQLYRCDDAASGHIRRHRHLICRFPARVSRQRDAIEPGDLVGRIRDLLARIHPGRFPVDEQPDPQSRAAVRIHAVADRLPQSGGGLRSDTRQVHHRFERDRSDRSWSAAAGRCGYAAVRRPHSDQQPGRRTSSADGERHETVGAPCRAWCTASAIERWFAVVTACSTKPKARAAG